MVLVLVQILTLVIFVMVIVFVLVLVMEADCLRHQPRFFPRFDHNPVLGIKPRGRSLSIGNALVHVLVHSWLVMVHGFELVLFIVILVIVQELSWLVFVPRYCARQCSSWTAFWLS